MLTFAVATAGFMAARRHAESKTAAAPYVFKMTWFLAIVAVEWQLLRRAAWLPEFLGGTGEGLWDPDTPDDQLGQFYEVQLAYHFHSLVFSIINGAKAEMHLHHCVTLALIALSDFLRYRRIGAVVFMLHDAPDIVGAAVKASIHAKTVGTLLFCYVVLLFTWAYFRLYLLLKLILDVCDAPRPYETRVVFAALLSVLLMLHYYWYALFLWMGITFRSKRVIKDISETDPNSGATVVQDAASHKSRLGSKQCSDEKEL